ncbi:hypothetical protein ACFFWC_27155 [Plantactinospora siamensis]|uniref:Uncharacterized protein n=1 Tax=Plantactinospora siamensis TaxID=555372 RepID=A0ABV6P0D5_9ACTN
MPMPRVALPSGRTGPEVATGIVDWIRSEPLDRLVRAFAGDPPAGDPAELLDWLEGFSARVWDFRAGRERPEAREPDLDPALARLVVTAADDLGMVAPHPAPRPAYAHLVVLGGLAPACLRRTGYAARLIERGQVTVDEVAVLGSFRPLSPAERAALAAVGLPECDTEFDALDAGLRLGFGDPDRLTDAGGLRDDPHTSWAERTYRHRAGVRIRVLAAPSGEPAVRRAHTADTQRFWAGRVRLTDADPVLLVTAPIYVPFQHCDALRTLGLPYSCPVDTVGIDPAADLAPLPEPVLTPGRYLQEIRSAIRSMRALHAALPGGAAR